MKSLTSFTINVAKGNKRKVGKSKNKVSRLCKGIVVKEDGEYQVRINTLDDPNNPSFITIPFTFDSYEVKDREFVFERNNTDKGKYICHVRDKYKAKVNFFTMSWKQDENDANSQEDTPMASWARGKRIRYSETLDEASNPNEAYLRTWGWNTYVPIFYFYFRKIDFPVDPDIHGNWEWAGIYLGNKL